MRRSRATDPHVRRLVPGRGWPGLPSWLISGVLHALILLAVGLTLRLAPRRGVTAERTAEVGIALKHEEGGREYYQSEGDAGKSSRAAGSGTPGLSLSDVLSDLSPVDPTASLPSGANLIGPGVLGAGGIPNAGRLTEGPSGRGGSMGGKGRTSMFKVTGEGWKFVYVLDRSDSMNWHHQKPLRAAKSELIASLASLESVHRFQIVFFNEQPEIFNPSGRPNRLAFATDQAKRNARAFVGRILADGGTDRQAALFAAIKLQPDVIFFLTDADAPPSPGQLYEINRRAAGITIHTIEFGLGPQRDPNNFLVKLAEQNGGQHGYVDISRL